MSSAKILIVDDELIMRESLSGWLQRDGHTVETASSGEAALEKARDYDWARISEKTVHVYEAAIAGFRHRGFDVISGGV